MHADQPGNHRTIKMSDGSYLIISTMGFTLSAIGVAYSNWLVNGENNIPSGEDMVQKNEVVAPGK